MKGLVAKESVVLCWWGSEERKFGLKPVDEGR